MEFGRDEPGAVDWLDSSETLGGVGGGGRSGGGGPARRRKLKLGLVATGAVAVLAAASLILQANHDFGPGPNSRTAAVGSVDWRETLPGSSIGMWTTSDSVVVATVSGLTTYSLSRGAKLWSWAPPSGDRLCAMSPTTSQGRGVVALGPVASADSPQIDSCASAQVIDVETGKAEWPEPVDLTQGGSPLYGSAAMDELSISGGFVVAPYGLTGIVSLDAATGARLWSSGQLPGYRNDVGGSWVCAEQGAQVLDGEVYALAGNSCTDSGISVEVYNAAKIASPQILPMPDDSPHCDARDRRVLATAADVLVMCGTYGGQSYPAYAIPQGTVQLITLAVQGIGGIAPADVGTQAAQLALTGGFVSGSGLVVESEHATGPVTSLTGIDLSTGTQLWQRSFPTGSRFYPLGAGAGGAVGVQTAGSDWTLLSMSPTTGATGSAVPLDSTALSGSGIDGSFDYAVVGSHLVTGELGANATVIVSTL